jgi:hypothetical protein
MLVGHLLAGFAEAAVAAAGVAFLFRSSPELLPADDSSNLPVFWLRLRFVLVILGILIVLTPLGLLAPGTAWGEWSSGQFYDLGLGFVPRGMQKLENFWQSFFPDYTIPGFGPGVGYFLSALLGVLLIFLVFQFTTWCGKMAAKKA